MEYIRHLEIGDKIICLPANKTRSRYGKICENCHGSKKVYEYSRLVMGKNGSIKAVKVNVPEYCNGKTPLSNEWVIHIDDVIRICNKSWPYSFRE